MQQQNPSPRRLLVGAMAFLSLLFSVPQKVDAQPLVPSEVLQTFERVSIGGLTFFVRKTNTFADWRQFIENMLIFESADVRTAIPAPVFSDVKRDIVFVVEDDVATDLSQIAVYIYNGRSSNAQLQKIADTFGNPPHLIVLLGPQRYLMGFIRGGFLLHEIAHYYHFREHRRVNDDIRAVFSQIVEKKLYNEAFGTPIMLRNHFEFFAELSVKFFSVHYLFPHNRSQLKQYDLESYCLARRVWLFPAVHECTMGK